MFRKRVLPFLTYAVFIAIGVLTLPEPLWFGQAGLDYSWMLGLHLAAANGFVFGKDIIFSYGPLGYLCFPLFVNRDLWMSAVVFVAVVHIAFFVSLAAVVLRSENRLLSGLVLGLTAPLVTFFLDTPYTLGALLLATAYFQIRYGRAPMSSLVLPLVAAFAFYAKADLGLLSFFIVLLTAALAYSRERCLKSLLPLAVFFVSLVAAGLFFTRNLEVFALFLLGYLNAVIGYGGAMSIDVMPHWLVIFPIFFSLVLFLLLMKWGRAFAPFLIISLPYLFVTFKHGFVREDVAHLFTFFGGWSLTFLLLQSSSRMRSRQLTILIPAILILFSGVGVANGSGLLNMQPSLMVATGSHRAVNFITAVYDPSQISHVFQTLDLMWTPEKTKAIFYNSALSLRHAYPLSNQTLALLQDHSVDVLPWDAALVYAYGLRWNPAPSFQACTAYTSYLDTINSKHYELTSSRAPEFILFSFKSIDGRYPLFDEPKTFRSILLNYEYAGNDGEFTILKQKKKNCMPMQEVALFQGRIGETILLPSVGEDYLFGKIMINSNLIGDLVGITYKPSPAYVQFVFDDASISQKYRLVLDTARDGLFLSQYADNIHDSSMIFQQRSTKQITAIIITVSDPKLYDSSITVTFLRLNCK